jgi:hypothetical protein
VPIRGIPAGTKGQVQYPYRERRYTMRDRSERQVRVYTVKEFAEATLTPRK